MYFISGLGKTSATFLKTLVDHQQSAKYSYQLLSSWPACTMTLHDNDFRLIIDIYLYEKLSSPNWKFALALQSLDTLTYVRINVLALLF
jgi:hypothetical protein